MISKGHLTFGFIVINTVNEPENPSSYRYKSHFSWYEMHTKELWMCTSLAFSECCLRVSVRKTYLLLPRRYFLSRYDDVTSALSPQLFVRTKGVKTASLYWNRPMFWGETAVNFIIWWSFLLASSSESQIVWLSSMNLSLLICHFSYHGQCHDCFTYPTRCISIYIYIIYIYCLCVHLFTREYMDALYDKIADMI